MRDKKIKFYIADIDSTKYYEFKTELNEVDVELSRNRYEKLKRIIEYQRLDEVLEELKEIKDIVYNSLNSTITLENAEKINNHVDDILEYIKDKNVIVTEI